LESDVNHKCKAVILRATFPVLRQRLWRTDETQGVNLHWMA